MNVKPFSTIVHKLRTPLTVIVSTVNNLLDGAFGPLNPEQASRLKKLESHTNNLEALLNEIFACLKEQDETTEKIRDRLENQPPGKTSIGAIAAFKNETGSDASNSEDRPLILAVDDEPDILDVMQEGLASQQFRVSTASTGEEAFRKAMELKPDLILMDVHLQNQNGLEVCRKIKAEAGRFIPVILVTGQDDLREKLSGSAQDADDLLTKPFQMVELFARVSSMLRLRKLEEQLERSREKGLNKDDHGIL